MHTLRHLALQLARYRSRPALGVRHELGVRWWSYERLDVGRRQVSSLLSRAGIEKGDYVLLCAPNCPEWVAIFLGAATRGAVLAPLDRGATPELIRRVVETLKPKLLIYSGGAIELPGVSSIDLNSLYGETPFDAREELSVAVERDDPAIAIHTSGTTAAPACVVLTHGNIMSVVDRFRRWRILTRLMPIRIAVMAPLSHTQGLILGMAIPLSLGLSTIYTESSHVGYLLRMIRDNRVVVLSTLPRVLHVMADVFRKQRYGKGPATLADKLQGRRSFYLRRHYVFTHMRRVVGYRFYVVLVGGAPLPVPDERFWRESGCFLVQGYGLSETTAMVTVNTPWSGAFGSVGKALGQQEIRIAEDGEILVRGPNVMRSSSSGRAADMFADGFLRTGDIGRVDEGGHLYITGRKKELIVTGEGYNVHPADVEASLNAMPEVEDSVVVGLDAAGHSQVHAALLLRPGIKAEEVILQANRHLLPHQRIQGWTVWTDKDFPRTGLLKPHRRMIEERVRTDSQAAFSSLSLLQRAKTGMAASDSKGDPGQLQALVDRILSDTANSTRDGSVSPVRDLGLGSLDMVELLLLLEKESGKIMGHVESDELMTLGRLRSLALDPVGQWTLSRSDEKDPPRWAEHFLLDLLRRFLNPAILRPWTLANCKLSVDGLDNIADIRGPVLLVAGGHRHGFDLVILFSALPPHLRDRIAVVVSRWVFGGVLKPVSDTTWQARLKAALGLRLLLPLFFPIALSSHFERTREGLMEACRLIDRGYSLLTFEGPGMALVAKQCGVPIVPVRIAGNQKLKFIPRLSRSAVSVYFGRPLDANPNVTQDHLLASLHEFFATA